MDNVLMIFLMLLATFSIRAFSINVFSGGAIPLLISKALALVPVSMLSAICTPLIFQPTGLFQNPLLMAEFWAATACILTIRFGALPSIIVSFSVYLLGQNYL